MIKFTLVVLLVIAASVASSDESSPNLSGLFIGSQTLPTIRYDDSVVFEYPAAETVHSPVDGTLESITLDAGEFFSPHQDIAQQIVIVPADYYSDIEASITYQLKQLEQSVGIRNYRSTNEVSRLQAEFDRKYRVPEGANPYSVSLMDPNVDPDTKLPSFKRYLLVNDINQRLDGRLERALELFDQREVFEDRIFRFNYVGGRDGGTNNPSDFDYPNGSGVNDSHEYTKIKRKSLEVSLKAERERDLVGLHQARTDLIRLRQSFDFVIPSTVSYVTKVHKEAGQSVRSGEPIFSYVPRDHLNIYFKWAADDKRGVLYPGDEIRVVIEDFTRLSGVRRELRTHGIFAAREGVLAFARVSRIPATVVFANYDVTDASEDVMVSYVARVDFAQVAELTWFYPISREIYDARNDDVYLKRLSLWNRLNQRFLGLGSPPVLPGERIDAAIFVND